MTGRSGARLLGRRRSFRIAPLAFALTLTACTPRVGTRLGPPRPSAIERAPVTVVDTTINAFSQPLPGLSVAERRAFFVGNAFFNDPWVKAPSSTRARDGLGPTFNATSCAGCHFKDGRGAPPSTDDPDRAGLVVRLSAIDPGGAQVPHPTYGDQLQDHAILGVPPEGRFNIAWEKIGGHFGANGSRTNPFGADLVGADLVGANLVGARSLSARSSGAEAHGGGTAYTLLRPRFELVDLAFGPLGDVGTTLAISPRTAPATFGLGLLEAVPEGDIIARADPDDRDGDGISGRANRVPDARTGALVLGRFGWKAGQPTIEQQVAGAFLGDLGITSALHPTTNCPGPQAACQRAIDGGSPELEDSRLARIVHYDQMLAAPAARDDGDQKVKAGLSLFAAARCDACHLPAMRTGPTAAVAALADQPFAPYTDLLLHDMGPGLADDRPEHAAGGTEWRTAPLWGIGLIPTVNRHDRLLHDGRARGIAEAILWHGGEGEAAKERFEAMTTAERAALVAFVASR